MEQSSNDWPFGNSVRFTESCQSESDDLAKSFANVVVCDCAVASIKLAAPQATRVEAGWTAIYVVRDGDCWLSVDGLDGSLQLHAGDTVLLPQGREHGLSTSDTPAYLAESCNLWDDTFASTRPERPSISDPAPPHSHILACRFRNHVGRISALLGALPATIHIPATDGRTSSLLESTIGLIDAEAASFDPGSRQIIAHLVQILFMQVLRHFLAGEQLNAPLQQSALTDPIVGLSLGLINNHLKTQWTLASLAEAVGVSRSTFAARFAEKVGTPPLAYLWQRRMESAVTMLSDNELGIKEIASRIGYKSESAFSTAFKRWSGMTPGAFRRKSQV